MFLLFSKEFETHELRNEKLWHENLTAKKRNGSAPGDRFHFSFWLIYRVVHYRWSRKIRNKKIWNKKSAWKKFYIAKQECINTTGSQIQS
jgi:hypothetical protein